MKVRIEIDESVKEEEVVIRCRRMDETILRIQSAIMEQSEKGHYMMLKQGGRDFYLPVEEILFFETENKLVYAHTRHKVFEAEYKLYELEELLPGFFMRISKSAIINLNEIYSIARNLTSSSVVEFTRSHKQVYVSRNYYKALAERLAEKRRKL
ncbi:LytTR family transcriptional regulator [Lachnospiraceae bacterium]|nr:LytTR family transcriptional regulator [Lachnospiraceae bacterium]